MRLRLQGADMSRVIYYNGIKKKTDDADKALHLFDVRTYLRLLEKMIAQCPDISTVIVDPITSALGDGDQNSNSEMRHAMVSLADFAKRTGVAVIVNTHYSKRADSNALYKIMGSVAFAAVARSIWIVHQDAKPEGFQQGDPEPPRKLLCEKQNEAGVKTGLMFDISDKGLVWRNGAIYETATEALSTSPKKGARRLSAENTILEALSVGLSKSTEDLGDEVVAKGIAFRTCGAKRTTDSGAEVFTRVGAPGNTGLRIRPD